MHKILFNIDIDIDIVLVTRVMAIDPGLCVLFLKRIDKRERVSGQTFTNISI